MKSYIFSNQEDTYLNEKKFPIVKENCIIISGCSGGGKSSLLAELAARGYSTVQEPGRQIVKEQIAINGDALPWSNPEKFLNLALSRAVFQFNSQPKHSFIFFDRGIIDTLQLEFSQPNYFQEAASRFRYNHTVFLVPPWKEIFINDAERKHDFELAQKEYQELLVKYKNNGYETIIIPKMSPKERVDFILEKIGLPPRISEGPSFYLEKAKGLLEWNKNKLTCNAVLSVEDLSSLFVPAFTVIANGREYHTDHANYYAFLNTFRSNIQSIHYEVQEFYPAGSSVFMPLTVTINRSDGNEEVFNAMLLLKFDPLGKITHWQEVYTLRP